MKDILDVKDYPFEENDFLFYLKNLWRDRGAKAIYQFANRQHRRPYSRQQIERFAPSGIGLEVGVGERTICPSTRTILSDGYKEHGVGKSIAKVYFRSDEIPYQDETFSFIVSEHVLEHVTNPLRALREWIRVLSPGGVIFLFLPHKERTNDRFREATPLKHLIDDYEKNVAADDETHLDEWWSNVFEKGLMPEHYRHLAKRDLIKTGSIHHHVWTEKEMVEVIQYLGLGPVLVDPKVHDRRDSFLVVGAKRS